MRITILDGRHLVGRFMAFDRHMNIVLGDAEEFRRLPPKKGVPEADREIRRPLGLVLIRGEEVISLTVEGPPPTDDRRGKRDVAPVRRPPPARALSVARAARGRPRRGVWVAFACRRRVCVCARG
jgi:small nuclear ribonucleoprotein B and B'